MIDQNIKNSYKTLIQKIETDHPLKDVLESFIDKYDGSDDALFNLAAFGMMNTLMELKILTIEARGFQDIQEELESREEKILELKEELRLFETLNQPDIPDSAEPFVATSNEEPGSTQPDPQE